MTDRYGMRVYLAFGFAALALFVIACATVGVSRLPVAATVQDVRK